MNIVKRRLAVCFRQNLVGSMIILAAYAYGANSQLNAVSEPYKTITKFLPVFETNEPRTDFDRPNIHVTYELKLRGDVNKMVNSVVKFYLKRPVYDVKLTTKRQYETLKDQIGEYVLITLNGCKPPGPLGATLAIKVYGKLLQGSRLQLNPKFKMLLITLSYGPSACPL